MMKITKKISSIWLFLIFLLSLIIGGNYYNIYHSIGSLPSKILFAVYVFIALSTISLIYVSIHKQLCDDFIEKILKFANSNKFQWISFIFLLLLIESGQDILFLKAGINLIFYRKYQILLHENFSILLGIFFFSLINVLLAAWLVIEFEELNIKLPGFTSATWLPFSSLLLLWGFLLYTDFGFQGIQLSEGFYQPTGVPLAGIQVGILVISIMGINRIRNYLICNHKLSFDSIHWDWIVMILLWASACYLWTTIPVQDNYFLDIGRAPNFEIYPESDSLFFGIEAYKYQNGEGFSNITQHPIYSIFLSILMLIGGHQYSHLIFMQIIVLAFIPVLIYHLFRRSGLRTAGILSAVFFIIRERNKIQLMDTVSNTNVKMLMTELPAVLVLICFFLVMQKWLDSETERRNYALLAGGILGVGVLVRIELMVMLLVFLAVGLLVYRNIRVVSRSGFFLLLGFMLFLTPWMVRNYQMTGEYSIDKNFSPLDGINNIKNKLFPANKEIGLPNSGDFPTGPKKIAGNQSLIIPEVISPETIKGDDSNVVFLGHLVNNVTQLFLILPSNHQPLLTIGRLIELPTDEQGFHFSKHSFFSDQYLTNYVRSLPYFWHEWNSEIVPRSIIPILINIIIVSIGVSQLIKNSFPFFIQLSLALSFYIIAYSFYGSSGNRYIQVVDWIFLSIYSVGLSGFVNRAGKKEV